MLFWSTIQPCFFSTGSVKATPTKKEKRENLQQSHNVMKMLLCKKKGLGRKFPLLPLRITRENLLKIPFFLLRIKTTLILSTLLSLYEGFSIAAIEGLASGTVSVFTDVPGLRDLKCIEGTIWIKLEVESLTESLKRVAGMSLQESMALGRHTHEEVKALYEIERGVRDYVKIYQKQPQN